jgi:hypothetical protein
MYPSTSIEGLGKKGALHFKDELDPYKISRLGGMFLGLPDPYPDPLVRDTDPEPSS